MKKFLFVFFCIFSVCVYGEKPKVLVTVPPYAYFVEKIAGSTVDIQVVVPPGANAHLYEPVPKEIGEMMHASIWMRLYDPMEKKLAKVLKEKNPTLIMVDLSKGIELLGHEHTHAGACHEDEKDFHFWLSPQLARKQVQQMVESLIKLSPHHQELYLKNGIALLQELTELDREIETLLSSLKGKAILVSHPAFGYFCRDYGLIQIPVEYEGKEPRPKQIAQILKQIEALKVTTVFTQVQYNNKGAELIAEKHHLPIFLVDPYSKDYSKTLLYLAKVISHDH